MSEELEVRSNTVLADLDCLRDEQRAPIEYDRSRHRYFLSDATWDLPPMQVSRQELFAFSVAAKLLEAFRGTPLETDNLRRRVASFAISCGWMGDPIVGWGVQTEDRPPGLSKTDREVRPPLSWCLRV